MQSEDDGRSSIKEIKQWTKDYVLSKGSLHAQYQCEYKEFVNSLSNKFPNSLHQVLGQQDNPKNLQYFLVETCQLSIVQTQNEWIVQREAQSKDITHLQKIKKPKPPQNKVPMQKPKQQAEPKFVSKHEQQLKPTKPPMPLKKNTAPKISKHDLPTTPDSPSDDDDDHFEGIFSLICSARILYAAQSTCVCV